MISLMTPFIYYHVCFYSTVFTGAFLRFAKIIPQAGDGSCLFHSLSYGIKDDTNASILRYDISTYIQQHPHTLICDTPLSDWVKWDSNTSCTEYSRRMKNGAWGMHSIIVDIVIDKSLMRLTDWHANLGREDLIKKLLQPLSIFLVDPPFKHLPFRPHVL